MKNEGLMRHETLKARVGKVGEKGRLRLRNLKSDDCERKNTQ